MICGGCQAASAQIIDGLKGLGGLLGAGGDGATVAAIEKQTAMQKLQFGKNMTEMVELVKNTKKMIGTAQSAYMLQQQIRKDLNTLTDYSVNLGESVKSIFETIYNSIPANDYTDFYAIYMERTAPLRGYNGELSQIRIMDAMFSSTYNTKEGKEGMRIMIENELFKSYYEIQWKRDLADVYDAVAKELIMVCNINFYAAYGKRAGNFFGNMGMSSSEKKEAIQTSRKEFEEKMNAIQETMMLVQELRMKSMELRRWRPEKSDVERMVQQGQIFYRQTKNLMKYYGYQDPQYGNDAWLSLGQNK